MKTDLVYLQHVLDSISKIESYISVGREVFMRESHWQDAVIRQLEIIGEAIKKFSKTCVHCIPKFLGDALPE